MQIYKPEIEAGLRDILLTQRSVSFCSEITKCEPWSDITEDEKNVVEAALVKCGHKALENNGLYRLDSILVTTGINKNLDVFERSETWVARSSADHKPFNYMHDGKDIIGHSVAHKVIDLDGNVLSDDLTVDELPDKFHIAESSVLYTFWEDQSDIERVQQILKEIPEGKWFVSAEAAFSDFDYAMISEDGEQIIVSRNAETAFLTKHLKSYGGSGVYDNYRVGRVLRNMVFAGKGLVTRPANPNSVIISDSDLFKPSKSALISFNMETSIMNEAELKSEISSLKAQVAELNKANTELLNSKSAEQLNTVKAELDEAKKELVSKSTAFDALNTEIKSLKDNISASASLVDELKTEISNLTKAKEASEEEMKKMKKEQKAKCRLQSLLDAGKTDEEANTLVAKFEILDDAQFNDFVQIISLSKNSDIDEDSNAETATETVLDTAKAEENVNLNSGIETSKSAENSLIETIVNKITKVRKNKAGE